MNLIDKATILHYHRHRMALFGEDSVRRLGWRGEDSQHKRFAAIAAAADFSGRTVLDVGCGCGDLKRFLDRRFTGFSYIGVDLMPGFIQQAQMNYAGVPETWFFERDASAVPLPDVDIVVASGVLGYRSADPTFHFNLIRKMYRSAREALIFNMLDAAIFPAHPLLVGRDIEEVMAECRALAPHAELIRGYLEDDFTVSMRRSGKSSG